jgi:hypothetical protein
MERLVLWHASRGLSLTLGGSTESWHLDDLLRNAKKIIGYVTVVIAIVIIAGVLLSAPFLASKKSSTLAESNSTHEVVDGLHIALPANLSYIAIEQLIALP